MGRGVDLGQVAKGSLEVCRLNSSGSTGQCGNAVQPIDICAPGVQTDCRATVNRNKRLPSCCWGCGGAEKIRARARGLTWCTWQMSTWLALTPFPTRWPGPRHRCTKRALQQLKMLLPHVSGCGPVPCPKFLGLAFSPELPQRPIHLSSNLWSLVASWGKGTMGPSCVLGRLSGCSSEHTHPVPLERATNWHHRSGACGPWAVQRLCREATEQAGGA